MEYPEDNNEVTDIDVDYEAVEQSTEILKSSEKKPLNV
jgi:hypothetical protein